MGVVGFVVVVFVCVYRVAGVELSRCCFCVFACVCMCCFVVVCGLFFLLLLLGLLSLGFLFCFLSLFG